MKKCSKLFATMLVAVVFASGCTNSVDVSKADNNTDIQDNSGQANESLQINNDKEKEDENDNQQTLDPKEAIDLSLKPNEAGQIMVLMYHGIDETEATWVRTPDNFRRDLQTLYEKGYRPISLKDFVSNNFEVEAGYTPFVLTFDDGNQNNFNIIEKDGQKIIDPNSAVGIMEEFKKEHPDFPLTATFFVFGSNPFRQKELVEYKLNYLVENGYDVGNHTLGHNNMTDIDDPQKIQKVIAEQADYLESMLSDYKIDTYALCNGGRPKNKDYYPLLQKGQFNEKEYNNVAVLNVGWDPSVPPVDKNFDPHAIHRVRASETNVDGVGLYDWLSVFEKNPMRRYISDGNVDIVTVPKTLEEKVDKEKLNGKELYIYDETVKE
ncbi:polysaccharide deacetylase family protein [Brassicibacter mesophilus]|uniref:polysaccharide deacetylase family protein n=1 Tax=Brassicibacter mesophilus TaxID=745119 RepID=UPI003D23E663